MNQDEWILKQLQNLYNTSNDYNQRTLMKAAQQIIKEQMKRTDQMEGEIEGTLWSPKRWGE